MKFVSFLFLLSSSILSFIYFLYIADNTSSDFYSSVIYYLSIISIISTLFEVGIYRYLLTKIAKSHNSRIKKRLLTIILKYYICVMIIVTLLMGFSIPYDEFITIVLPLVIYVSGGYIYTIINSYNTIEGMYKELSVGVVFVKWFSLLLIVIFSNNIYVLYGFVPFLIFFVIYYIIKFKITRFSKYELFYILHVFIKHTRFVYVRNIISILALRLSPIVFSTILSSDLYDEYVYIYIYLTVGHVMSGVIGGYLYKSFSNNSLNKTHLKLFLFLFVSVILIYDYYQFILSGVYFIFFDDIDKYNLLFDLNILPLLVSIIFIIKLMDIYVISRLMYKKSLFLLVIELLVIIFTPITVSFFTDINDIVFLFNLIFCSYLLIFVIYVVVLKSSMINFNKIKERPR